VDDSRFSLLLKQDLPLCHKSLSPECLSIPSVRKELGFGYTQVVFPVVLNPNDRQKRKTLWVKAGIGAVQQEDGAAVEKLLKEALSEVQREKDAPSQAENDQGEIKPSSNTGAFVSIDRQEVTRHVLSAS